jgi:hypothetical protein
MTITFIFARAVLRIVASHDDCGFPLLKRVLKLVQNFSIFVRHTALRHFDRMATERDVEIKHINVLDHVKRVEVLAYGVEIAAGEGAGEGARV